MRHHRHCGPLRRPPTSRRRCYCLLRNRSTHMSSFLSRIKIHISQPQVRPLIRSVLEDAERGKHGSLLRSTRLQHDVRRSMVASSDNGGRGRRGVSLWLELTDPLFQRTTSDCSHPTSNLTLSIRLSCGQSEGRFVNIAGLALQTSLNPPTDFPH
jgi:hypothetical protein